MSGRPGQPRRIVPTALADGWADGWPLTSPVGRFLEGVRDGNTAVVAALVAGLDPGDVAKWAAVGSGLLAKSGGRLVAIRRRPFSDFAVALARAEAANEEGLVAVIKDMALADTRDSWRAAAWLLEHQSKAAPPVAEEDDDDEIEWLSEAVPAEGGDGPDAE